MKRFIRIVAFLAVFVLLFSTVNYYMARSVDHYSANALGGFYKQPRGSLDAVYIGSSNVLAFWNQMIAWEQYGITVYPYSCVSQQLTAAEYAIKDIRKTHPDVAFVININTIGLKTNTPSLHRLFDNMPFSINKVQAIEAMSEMYGLTDEQKKELYFPILRYHSRWEKMTGEDFVADQYMGAFDHPSYWEKTLDMTKLYTWTDGVLEPPAHVRDSLKSLLDYCDREKLKVIFVTVPRKEVTDEECQMINYANNLIREHGYTTVVLTKKVDELQLDLQQDFYNRTHTNAHGAAKFTNYVAQVLVKELGLENKRGNPDYQNWDDAYTAYKKISSRYLLDFELTNAKRDNTLLSPANLSAVVADDRAAISFDAVKGATGYAVYKREGEKGLWAKIGETSTLQFFDKNYDAKTSCDYAVVPFYQQNGATVYGNYQYNGITIS